MYKSAMEETAHNDAKKRKSARPEAVNESSVCCAFLRSDRRGRRGFTVLEYEDEERCRGKQDRYTDARPEEEQLAAAARMIRRREVVAAESAAE